MPPISQATSVQATGKIVDNAIVFKDHKVVLDPKLANKSTGKDYLEFMLDELSPNGTAKQHKDELEDMNNDGSWTVVKSASSVQARIKGLDEYTWLTYNGAPLNLSYKNNPFTVNRGDIFGVRKGTGDTKRIVFARPDLGLTRVLTLRSDLEAILSKRFSKLAPTLQQVEQAFTE